MASVYLSRAILAGFLISTSATGYTVHAIRHQRDQALWVRRTSDLRLQVAQLFVLVRGAGLGLRLYALTHEDSLLDNYRLAKAEVPAKLASIISAAQDGPAQQQRLERLRRAIDERMIALKDVQREASTTEISLRENNRIVERLKVAFADLDAEEARLLDERTREAEASEQTAEHISWLGLIFSIVMSIFGARLERLDRERERKIAEAASTTDELTGLLNRRGFLLLAAQQARVSRRAGEKCLVLYVDVDGLKRINDDLGHAAGDDALRQMGAVLRTSTRSSDIVGRLGGDEFVVFAPAGDKPNAVLSIASRIQGHLRFRSAVGNEDYPLEASTGLTWMESDQELEEVLAQADQEMYSRKRAKKKQLDAGRATKG